VVLDEPSSEVAVAVRQLAGRFIEATGGAQSEGPAEAEARPKKKRRFARA
jgi:hypothetical protein